MSHPYQIDEDTFSDGQYKFTEQNLCQHCREKHEANLTPFKWADTRTSFGIYAGRYCDDCWKNSGYRDATDPDAVFDPMDAGECLEAEDY
jgi:hypothetical protein